MVDLAVIRDLAKAAGCTRELTDAEAVAIRRKLACAYIDGALDNPDISGQPNVTTEPVKSGTSAISLDTIRT